MKELSPSARRLFELARGQDDPDELARTRVGRALSAMIAAEATLLAAGALAPKSIAAGVGAIAAKYTLVVGVTGALVAAGWLTLRTAQPVARPVASSHQAAPAAPSPPILVEAEPAASAALPAAAAREPSKATVSRKPARPAEFPAANAAVTQDVLRAETEALRLAQQALRDQQPEQALRLLAEQDVRFRDGLLRQERAAARVLALCQAGKADEARAQALRFERSWPRSALLARVRAACWAL
jgi:hypothetical protein